MNHVRRNTLGDFSYFLAIAQHGSFRRAALELGISAAALSQSLKGLESRIGVRLLDRTTQKVMLTCAGKGLYDAIKGPFDAIAVALKSLDNCSDEPSGSIRLNVMADASLLLLAPVLPVFIERYPAMEIEITVSRNPIEAIAQEAEAAIAWGGLHDEGVIVERLSPDMPWIVVGAPGYLDRFGIPQHPSDLQGQRCLRLRVGPERVSRWKFRRGDEELDIDVTGAITVNETPSAACFATAGAGLAYLPEPCVATLIGRGDLRVVLEDWSLTEPGFHIYRAAQRDISVGLRGLIDLIRELCPLGQQDAINRQER